MDQVTGPVADAYRVIGAHFDMLQETLNQRKEMMIDMVDSYVQGKLTGLADQQRELALVMVNLYIANHAARQKKKPPPPSP